MATTKKIKTLTEHDGRKFGADNLTIYGVLPLGRDIAVISVSEHRGKQSLDLRRFYADDESDTWKPTGKGIRFNVDQVPEVQRLITMVAGVLA